MKFKNPYLAAIVAERETQVTALETVRAKAVAEKRDLSEAEQGEATRAVTRVAELDAEIKSIVEQEERAAATAAVLARAAQADDTAPAEGKEVSRSAATTRDRDPGHYTKESNRSFFGDVVRAAQGDRDAQRRQDEHTRAHATGDGTGAGIILPKWMVDEYQGILRDGRHLANVVRRIDISGDPRPIVMPKQTGGRTAAQVPDQAAENDPVTYTDTFDSDVDTVTPTTVTAGEKYSRQFLDSADRSVDQLLFAELVGAYNQKVEALVCARAIASAGSAVATLTLANIGAADGGLVDAVIDTGLAVRIARKSNATVGVFTPQVMGKVKKIKDADGRPLIPRGAYGTVNVFGRGDVQTDLEVEGYAFTASEGMGTGALPETVLLGKADDFLLFEGNLMRFKYEEVEGPQTIRLGIWNYVGTYVKYAGSSFKKFTITAA